MDVTRRVCKAVKVGNIVIGGDAPIAVQSMLNVPAADVEGNVPAGARAGSRRV